MGHTGKLLRLSRFRYRGSHCGLIVPIDHGLTVGPVSGLESVARIGSWIEHPGITGIIAHKGMIERLAGRDMLGKLGVMLHLNGMSTLARSPDSKEMLTDIEAALRLGVDGVSVQVNYDGSNDAHNMVLLGRVADQAHRYGIPVLTMLYDKVPSQDTETRIARLRHLMRIALELGSDSLKIAAPSSPREIPAILDGIAQDIPIFFAGGALCSDEQLLTLAVQAVHHGGSGLCTGRNVFQRDSADGLLTALSQILRGHQPGQAAQPAPVALAEERQVA
jgi:class I fructose-bisphosphate aldolase